MRTWMLVPMLFLTACGVDPAPADIDAQPKWFWRNYDDATDADVVDAVNKLHVALGKDEWTKPDDGSLTLLSKDDLKGIGLDADHDPSKTYGLFVQTIIPCTLEKLEPLLYALDQDKLHDGYDSYERTYVGDIEAYEKREETQIEWTVDITASPTGLGKYSESLRGGLRFVPKSAGSPFGPIVLARTFMPKPAVVEDSDNSFPQDYQIEVYYERKPGETVHLFGLWRQMNVSGVPDATVQAFQIDGFKSWDEDTAKGCR